MKARPTILAFDTSAAHCAAALMWGDCRIVSRKEDMSRGQGERLMGLLEDLLTQERVNWSDLDAIAVGVGPGNFTGIRIAVSAARGLALGLGIPAISVSNFEIMRGPMSVNETDPQLVSLPAPRDTLYLQTFRNGQAVGKPSVSGTAPDDLAKLQLPDNATVLGQNALDIWGMAAGSSAEPTGRVFERSSAEVPETMVRIAAAKWHAGQIDGTRPAPMYVRPADAAPPREKPPLILP
jgi:tRNA threonylcarbamoyladenosine biosynthesis protein TsaB